MQEWTEPRANSEILSLLEQGGRLEAVATVVAEGRKLLRIEINADNPVKKTAERLSRASEEGIRSDTPEQRQLLKARMERQLGAPATRKFVYLLDPALHYAVRQQEEWYEPNSLLRRCVASHFQKLSDRQLWLPWKCEIDYYTFDTLPGVVSQEPIVSETFDVSQVGVGRVADSSFVINSSEPGTRVNDGTLADAKQDRHGYTRYVIPARAADLAQVIEMAKRGGPASLPNNGGWSYGKSFIAINAVVVLALASFLFVRRQRQPRS